MAPSGNTCDGRAVIDSDRRPTPVRLAATFFVLVVEVGESSLRQEFWYWEHWIALGGDLSDADLAGADLNTTNLFGANLFRANLKGANPRQVESVGNSWRFLSRVSA